MDNAQALQIIAMLANGTNPATGEIFPPDSPYQSSEIVRALYVAVRVLETQAPLTMEKPEKSNPPRNPTLSNAGKPWRADEDKQLLAAFDSGHSVSKLAQTLARTEGGIRARLEKHGRLESSPATRWPANNGARQRAPGDGTTR